MFSFGYIQDPPKAADEKPDWDAGELLGASPVPYEATARAFVASILNQGRVGSCVANAGFQAVRANHVKQGIANPKLGARLFGYYFARAYHHMTAFDSGTHLRTFFEALNKFGFPPEEEWPYDDNPDPETGKFRTMPSSTAVRAAFDQKAPTVYRRIYESGYERIDAIKRAVVAGHLVCFGTDVSQRFANGEGVDVPLGPPDGEPIAGGHAMCVDSYEGDDFGIVNSWGEGFAVNGFCTFKADYLAWDRTRDLWVVEHSPNFSG